MSRREPTPDEEKQFWMILRASAPSWNALALERLLEYFVKAPATGSADALAVAEAAFPAFANAPLASRAEAMASISSDQAFKQAKKALGIKPPQRPVGAAGPKRPRAPKPDVSPVDLLDFWARVELSAGGWEAPERIDNLLAYYLREPISGCSSAKGVIDHYRERFFAAPSDRQREAMESLSTTPEMKAARKASLPARQKVPAASPRVARPR